ncbi:MAG: ABC transporter ATP-binding protein [Verrucomicrobiota bacterium]|nr:ABC transporter ATP-binding protein [Verrucomicrobiota bacterium]
MSKSLRVQDITKIFPRAENPALDKVSISLSDGDIMALVGESGSGKTTLLRIIAGLENPDSGLVEIDGEIAWSSQTKTLLPEDRNIGFVFQDYALFPHLTVKNNILYGLHKIHQKSDRVERLKEIVSLTGLENLEHRFPHELSGGQQQRVALARALAPEPNFILLDEPFSNLDPVRKDSLRDELRSVVKESGVSALIVTHDTRDALSVADTLAVLKDGRLEQVGSPERVYFHSTSEYTASLFGKVNRIPCQLFKGEGAPNESTDILVRPADLEITKDPTGDVHIVGRVIANNFRGDFHEVTLECGESVSKSDSVTHVSIYVSPERKLQLGDTVTVRRLKR